MRLFAFAAIVALLPGLARADELLRLVPADYTFCVVVRDLKKAASDDPAVPAWKKLLDSPLAQRLLATEDIRRLGDAKSMILEQFQTTVPELRDGVFGDLAVFAYRKSTDRQPEDGTLLIRATDARALIRFVDSINQIQVREGQIKSVEAPTADRGYSRRIAPDGTVRDAFLVDGKTLIYATREETLKSIIALRSAEVATVLPPLAVKLSTLGIADSPIAVLVNPRSFDADLAGSEAQAVGSEKAFVRQFRQYLKSVESAALFARGRDAVEIGLAIQVQPDSLPPGARQAIAELSKRSPLWSSVPERPLLAVVGRFHVESLTTMFAPFFTAEDREKIIAGLTEVARPFLEQDRPDAIIRGLGPDVGLWVGLPSGKSWVPDMTAAVRVANTDDGKTAEAGTLRGLDFLARMACLSNKALRVRSNAALGTTTVYSGPLPAGFEPTFGAKNGYIVLASSPETFAAFKGPTGEAISASEVPLVRISIAAWRDYLSKHRDAIVAFGAGNGDDPKKISARINDALPLLEGLSELELLVRPGKDHASIVLRVK